MAQGTYFHALANDDRGMAFELEGDAKKWRVQRITRTRGRQEPLYGLNHRPLEVSIDSSAEDLADAMREANYEPAGRYRLVPVDSQGVQADDQCAFIVFRADGEEEAEPRNAGVVYSPPPPGPSSVSFDVAAITQAITEGIRSTLEPTMVTLRSVLTKLVDSNVSTTDGLLRSRVPQVFEPLEDDQQPIIENATPAEQLAQLSTIAAQFLSMFQAFQQQQSAGSAEPRNGAATEPSFGLGGNGERS